MATEEEAETETLQLSSVQVKLQMIKRIPSLVTFPEEKVSSFSQAHRTPMRQKLFASSLLFGLNFWSLMKRLFLNWLKMTQSKNFWLEEKLQWPLFADVVLIKLQGQIATRPVGISNQRSEIVILKVQGPRTHRTMQSSPINFCRWKTSQRHFTKFIPLFPKAIYERAVYNDTERVLLDCWQESQVVFCPTALKILPFVCWVSCADHVWPTFPVVGTQKSHLHWLQDLRTMFQALVITPTPFATRWTRHRTKANNV